MKDRIALNEGELAKLIGDAAQSGEHVHCAFGIGWVALEYDTDEPLPWAVRRLGELRGVFPDGDERNCAAFI